jgi:hypothetical protein
MDATSSMGIHNPQGIESHAEEARIAKDHIRRLEDHKKILGTRYISVVCLPVERKGTINNLDWPQCDFDSTGVPNPRSFRDSCVASSLPLSLHHCDLLLGPS